jgi:thiol-disulfide isomerase/thioredoxin
MKNNKRWILILFMAVIPILGIWALNNPGFVAKAFLNLGGIKEGEMFPAVQGEEVSGESFVLESGRGKPYVAMIARIDCEVCKSSYPILEENAELLNEMNFVMIGKGGKEEYLQVRTDHNFSFPILYADEQIQKDLKIKVFPTFYFIDNEGKIMKRLDGFDEKEFLKSVEELKEG